MPSAWGVRLPLSSLVRGNTPRRSIGVMTGRTNWSRIKQRSLMRRRGVEDIKGATPVAVQPPKQPGRKLSKAELREQAAAAFLAWRAVSCRFSWLDAGRGLFFDGPRRREARQGLVISQRYLAQRPRFILRLNAVAIIGSAITSGYGEGARLDGPAMPQSGPELERGIEVSKRLPRSPVRALQWSCARH